MNNSMYLKYRFINFSLFKAPPPTLKRPFFRKNYWFVWGLNKSLDISLKESLSLDLYKQQTSNKVLQLFVSFFAHNIFCTKDLGISQISPWFFMLESPAWFQNEERSLLYNLTEPDFFFFPGYSANISSSMNSFISCRYFIIYNLLKQNLGEKKKKSGSVKL